MAVKLHMSLNSYTKLERGESKLCVNKLEQIAKVFNISITDLTAS